jgi:hypothetical protein
MCEICDCDGCHVQDSCDHCSCNCEGIDEDLKELLEPYTDQLMLAEALAAKFEDMAGKYGVDATMVAFDIAFKNNL